jgi:transposase
VKQTENNGHIPKEKRDDMARIALGVSRNLTNAEARKAVAGMFQVSVTTAKRLITRGKFLAGQGEQGAA